MRAHHVAWIGFWLTVGSVGPALAQPIAAPTTPTRGLFGSRRGESLSSPAFTLSLNLGGGYDQNPESLEGALPPIGIVEQFGAIGTAAGSLSFRKGSTVDFVEASGGGYVNHSSGGVQRVRGGDASLEVASGVGRRNGLTVGLDARYQPTFLFNAYGPVSDQIEGNPPASGPSQGITDQQWLNLQGNLGFFRNWSPRQRGDVRYTRSMQEPMNGPGFESWSQILAYTHNWNTSQRLALRPSYRFSQSRQRDEMGVELPLDSHSGGLELTYTKPVSPNRILSVSGGIGLTRSTYELPTETYDFTLPTFSGAARLSMGQDWSLSADVGRDVTLLEGLSPEPFATNAVSLRADGLIERRIQIVLSGGLSNGGGLVTEDGSFDAVVGTAQLQIALGRRWAVYTGYSYYRYRLNDVRVVAPGVPSRYELNSIRVGLNLWLPLYGPM